MNSKDKKYLVSCRKDICYGNNSQGRTLLKMNNWKYPYSADPTGQLEMRKQETECMIMRGHKSSRIYKDKENTMINKLTDFILQEAVSQDCVDSSFGQLSSVTPLKASEAQNVGPWSKIQGLFFPKL